MYVKINVDRGYGYHCNMDIFIVNQQMDDMIMNLNQIYFVYFILYIMSILLISLDIYFIYMLSFLI